MDVKRNTQPENGSVSQVQRIYRQVRSGILDGTFPSGSRLPSWQDMASQLGVSRSTVKRAFELLSEERLINSRGAAGTWVCDSRPTAADGFAPKHFSGSFYDPDAHALDLQIGIPEKMAFPTKSWVTCWRQAVVRDTGVYLWEPQDPRGLAPLRQEIAAHVAVARGIRCGPDQIIITNGFSASLNAILQVLGLSKGGAIVENPGFPRTRAVLRLAGMTLIPTSVDWLGIDTASPPFEDEFLKLAVVTPSHHAPFGMSLASERRVGLLEWAEAREAYIIEDDYAGDVLPYDRAGPALAAAGSNRVFHVGSFSKTIGPSLRIGFVVVPIGFVDQFARYADAYGPASPAIAQHALLNFVKNGHYLRHLRRLRQLNGQGKTMLVETLKQRFPSLELRPEGAISVGLMLGERADDQAISARCRDQGLGALPLSSWYEGPHREGGLLIGFSNVEESSLVRYCDIIANALGAHR